MVMDGWRFFRLDAHIERIQKSAERLYLPAPDASLLREMIIDLVRRCRDMIPDAPGSLYLRPTLIGIDPNIGKAAVASDTAMLYVLASPVGDYFTPGTPLKLLVETEHQRCAPHMGSVKSGGNYASALYWQMIAKKEKDVQQVLFCPNGDVQETGASNFILIQDNTLITKSLSDEFLHGVTRRTTLQIAQDLGYQAHETSLSVDDLREAINNGAEAALTGTAAVIAPVTAFLIGDETIEVQSQEHALKLRRAIMDVQYGLRPDPHGWLTFVD
ncbi:branched-chain-amino-acid transaminase [Suttonella sp. R2A3]|nr:branched-chain-amino-acid transaminase [Suttonella sp. R2A3]UJF25397.1 branched-chain-amino-acid transaminase [Suttonella sp. R2A3]